MWLLRALALAAPLTAVHLVGMAVVAAAVGAQVNEVRLFFGPALTLRRERPRIGIGVFPFGGYVRLHGLAPEDAPDGPRFDSLPRWRRALVFLAGNVALLVVAAFALGPVEALASAARALPQLASLFLDHAGAVRAVRAFAAIDSPTRVLGLVAAKMAVFNLLPLAGLNGEALARLAIPRGRAATLDRAWGVVSSVVVLAIAGALLAAMLRA